MATPHDIGRPAAGNLEIILMRAVLFQAGHLSWDGSVPPPEPPMSLREILSRALILAQPWLFGDSDPDDWDALVGQEADELLGALALVLMPPGGTPN